MRSTLASAAGVWLGGGGLGGGTVGSSPIALAPHNGAHGRFLSPAANFSLPGFPLLFCSAGCWADRYLQTYRYSPVIFLREDPRVSSVRAQERRFVTGPVVCLP